jgi:SAM-dependent methyltransferase
MRTQTRTDDLYDRQHGLAFYEERYRTGYMEQWPEWKRKRVVDVVRSLGLPATGEALDFGCGNGVFTDVLREALPEWTVYGVDISTIAVGHARDRYPDCTFFTASDPAYADRRFDFLFTHHVLEHVDDVGRVWREMAALLRTSASAMLHVLPCGNPGSFEHGLCLRRRDGIDPSREGRWYLDDVGHLRRLDTERMTRLARDNGFRLSAQKYACHFWGTVHWMTEHGSAYAAQFVDPASGRTVADRWSLRATRFVMSAVAGARRHARPRPRPPGAPLAARLKAVIGRSVVRPLCEQVDRYVARRDEREWTTRRGDPAGSEMYLYFTRASP